MSDLKTTPVRLDIQREKGMTILWQDGTQSVYSLGHLRAQCPCAGCKEFRAQPKTRLPILQGVAGKPLAIVDVRRVGNYALQIDWSDGHDTGIYSFIYLRSISPNV